MERAAVVADGNHGRIKRLCVENFMCHDKFEMEFSPQVNVITGRNGSGKSTILTALMIGLGGTTRHTSRGENLGSLIKNGQTNAWIEVTIEFPPQHPYFTKYSGQVTVQRHLRGKTAGYTFKDAAGKPIRNKRAAVEVKLISDSCRFYFQNPLAVLTQEQAKFFLATATPDRKYLELQKATRMLYIKEDMEKAKASLEEQEKDRMDLVAQKEECEKLEQSDQQFFRVQEEADAELTSKHQTLEWRQVRQLHQHVDEARSELAEIERNVAEARTAADGGRTQAETELENEIAAHTHRLQDLREERNAANARVDEVQLQRDQISKVVDRAELDCRSIAQKRERSAAERARLEREEAESNPAAIQESRERLELEIAETESRIESSRAKTDTLDSDASDARSAWEKAKQDLTPLEQQIKQFDDEITRSDASLRHLRSGQGGSYSAYGPKMEDLMRRIETSTWQKKPVGPLGRHVAVKDPKWAPVLEKLLTRTTSSFLVETDADRHELVRLVRSVNANFAVIKREPDAQFRFDEGLIPEDPRYTRLIDALAFDSPTIRNLFVDTDRIEAVALAHSRQDAFSTISITGRDRRLRNVLCLMGPKKAMRYSARDATSTDSDPMDVWQGAFRMKTDNRSQVRQIEESIESAKLERERLISQRRDAAMPVQELRDEYELLREKHQQAQLAERTLAQQLRTLKRELRELPVNFTDHSGEIARLKREIELLDRQAEAAAAHRDAQQQELGQIETRLEQASKGPLLAQSQVEQLEAEIQEFYDRQRNFERLRADGSRTLRYLENQLQNRIAIVEHRDEGYQEALERAQALGGDESAAEAYDDRTNQQLQQDIAELKQLKNTNAAMAEGIDARRRKREFNLRQLSEIRVALGIVEVDIGRCQQMLEDHANNSADVWEKKRKKMREDFEGTLNKRLRYKSKLEIDDNKRRLYTHVDTGGGLRKAGTLSGGEKSFTQVALLMAIWKQLSVGFVAMDEYDVYMDKLNRHRSLLLLLETVVTKDIQCVLITPQDIQTDALTQYKDHVKITRMDDPLR